LWDAFGSFRSGMMAAFERDYPELKKENITQTSQS
jgi:hypothetical protein